MNRGQPDARAGKGTAQGRLLCKLTREALQWAKRLLALAPEHAQSSLPRVFQEVHAYAVFLLRARLDGQAIKLSPRDAAAVRRIVGRELRQKPDDAGGAESQVGFASSRPQLTPEMFERFRRATGLGSDVLVGEGINQGSIVFYIVLFGLLVADDRATAQQQARLLRAAQACRQALLGLIDTDLRCRERQEPDSPPPRVALPPLRPAPQVDSGRGGQPDQV